MQVLPATSIQPIFKGQLIIDYTSAHKLDTHNTIIYIQNILTPLQRDSYVHDSNRVKRYQSKAAFNSLKPRLGKVLFQ